MMRIHSVTYAQLKALCVIEYRKKRGENYTIPTVNGIDLEVTDEEPQNQLAIAVAGVLLKQFEEE